MRTDRRTAAQIRCFGVKFRIENGLFGNVVFPEGKDTIAHEDCEQKWAQRHHRGGAHRADAGGPGRSEERRVGKECRSRWSPYH